MAVHECVSPQIDWTCSNMGGQETEAASAGFSASGDVNWGCSQHILSSSLNPDPPKSSLPYPKVAKILPKNLAHKIPRGNYMKRLFLDSICPSEVKSVLSFVQKIRVLKILNLMCLLVRNCTPLCPNQLLHSNLQQHIRRQFEQFLPWIFAVPSHCTLIHHWLLNYPMKIQNFQIFCPSAYTTAHLILLIPNL